MPKVKTDDQGRLVLPEEFLKRRHITPKTKYCVHGITMQIRVKLFATLGRHARNGAAGVPFEMEVSDGATLADLVKQLKLAP